MTEEWVPRIDKLGNSVQPRLSFAHTQYKAGSYDKAIEEIQTIIQMGA